MLTKLFSARGVDLTPGQNPHVNYEAAIQAVCTDDREIRRGLVTGSAIDAAPENVSRVR
jgi:hypothetical protein